MTNTKICISKSLKSLFCPFSQKKIKKKILFESLILRKLIGMFLQNYLFPIYLNNWLCYFYAVYFLQTLNCSQIKEKWWRKKMCPWNLKVQVRCWYGNRNLWCWKSKQLKKDHLWNVSKLLVCFLSNSAISSPSDSTFEWLEVYKIFQVNMYFKNLFLHLFGLTWHFGKKNDLNFQNDTLNKW